jgi:hypothetical protein
MKNIVSRIHEIVTVAVRLFFIVPEAETEPSGLFLLLEECFSIFQHTGKSQHAPEACFSSFQSFQISPSHFLNSLVG